MLWDIRARMKPALAVIDMIPNIHRTPALALLRRAVLDGRPASVPLTPEDKALAFYDGTVKLTSPIGAQVLKSLYFKGEIKLKKPAQKSLPTLDAYIATEAAFRAEVSEILAAEEAKRQRLAEIIADPDIARPDELTPYLIDKVMSARFGHTATGEVTIAGLTCFRALRPASPEDDSRLRPEGEQICWWLDAEGNRQGDPG
ncbi:MAG: hypothetical protein P8O10_15085 [Pseudorhodobacter sp.]|nr:hypothetical protein [Pseudorhodobacter sp.]